MRMVSQCAFITVLQNASCLGFHSSYYQGAALRRGRPLVWGILKSQPQCERGKLLLFPQEGVGETKLHAYSTLNRNLNAETYIPSPRGRHHARLSPVVAWATLEKEA